MTFTPVTTQQVLIIDDSKDLRALVTKALGMEGYAVADAGDGVEALIYLETNTIPDPVFVDLSMPGMDGEDFVKRLRQHPRASRAKIVIISGWDDLEERAGKMAVEGFLRKPFSLDQLYAEVRRHIPAKM